MNKPTIAGHVAVSSDGVTIDGVPVPWVLNGSAIVSEMQPGGMAVVLLPVVADRVSYVSPTAEPEPKMTQAEARDIFRRRNPAAFKETSA